MRNTWKQMILWATVIGLFSGCMAVPFPETTTQTTRLEEPFSEPSLRGVGQTSSQTEPASAPEDSEVEDTTDFTTQVATEEPDPAETTLRKLTLEERIAQLFVVTPEALTNATAPLQAVDETIRDAFFRIPVGGVLCMGENLKGQQQTANLCADLQALSLERLGLPLFLCVDEEGGTVARISGNPAFELPSIPPMAKVGATGDPSRAHAIGKRIGAYLSDLGFNVDFAPDADVLTNPKNQIVRSRSFGNSAELVT